MSKFEVATNLKYTSIENVLNGSVEIVPGMQVATVGYCTGHDNMDEKVVVRTYGTELASVKTEKVLGKEIIIASVNGNFLTFNGTKKSANLTVPNNAVVIFR